MPVPSPEMERAETVTVEVLASEHFEVDGSKNQVIATVVEYGPSNGSVYYLAEGGDDTNTGEAAAPFATLSHALSVLTAGDTLYIKDGTYVNKNFTDDHGENGNSHVGHGPIGSLDVAGTADNWITIAAEPDGNDTRPLLRFDGAGGIELKPGTAYVRIEGLEIEGPNKMITHELAYDHRWSKENFYKGRGLFSWGPVHHIIVQNCDVHHAPGSGIRFNKADYIMVEGNIVSNNTWWSSSAESGIVVATAEHIDEEDAIKVLYTSNIVYNN